MTLLEANASRYAYASMIYVCDDGEVYLFDRTFRNPVEVKSWDELISHCRANQQTMKEGNERQKKLSSPHPTFKSSNIKINL